MTPPLVDLPVRLQPAQLLSENTSISHTSPWNLYSVTTLGASMRYRMSLLNFFTCPLVGAAMPLHTFFCDGGVDVISVVTPLVRGVAQVLHGDQVVELSVQLEVQEVEGKEENREGQVEVEEEKVELKEKRT